MRDMTDTMYNPTRWPYVSHFEGTRRVISHIERYVCPTITSDQWLGGSSFRFTEDRDTNQSAIPTENDLPADDHWQRVTIRDLSRSISDANSTTPSNRIPEGEPSSFRCIVRIPERWFSQNKKPSEPTIRIHIGNQLDARIWIDWVEQKNSTNQS